MAVPPADDGSVADPAAPGATPTLVRNVTLLSAAVCVICLGVLAYLFATDTDAEAGVGTRLESLVTGGDAAGTIDAAAEREVVLSQATQYLLRVNTFGPDDLDEGGQLPDYNSRVGELLSDKFRADFETEGLPLAEQIVSESGYGRTAEVYTAGVAGLDADSATVLVVGQLVNSYPDPEDDDGGRIEEEPRRFRYEVGLVKVEGEWLVDRALPVVDDETPATPDEPGTEVPTDDVPEPTEPPASPEDGPTTGGEGE